MNAKFMKALYQLDQGKYTEAEENIRKAIAETTSPYELSEIYSCYAEVLFDMERYDDAMNCVDQILNNEDMDNEQAISTALEIKERISELQ